MNIGRVEIVETAGAFAPIAPCRRYCALALTASTSIAMSRTSRRMFMSIANDASAKFWLDPVQLAANFGFRAHQLR
jgi:hypothetical protein